MLLQMSPPAARAFSALLLSALLLAASACTNQSPSPNAAPGLRIEPTKSQYRAGEPVVLSVTLTNRTNRSCRLSRQPAGAVVFSSLTRDSQPVLPTLLRASYIAGFQDFLAAALVEVGPGQSLSMKLASQTQPSVDGRAALETSTLDSGNEESLLVWPVDRAGSYRLTAAYTFPSFAERPADVCPGQTDWVSASFAVAAT
jgi:hypothetical protein